jgi:hypothetical protein
MQCRPSATEFRLVRQADSLVLSVHGTGIRGTVMRPRVRLILSLPTVILALLIGLAGGSSYPQSSIDQSSSSEQPAPPVPLSVRRTLDAALASEAKAIKIDAQQSNRFPLPVCDGGACGAVNRDGTWAVAPAYNRVESFFEGRAIVEVRHRYTYLYGFVDDTGRVISKPQFTLVDRFSRGFAQVEVEDRSGLIDREGQVAVWPRFGFVVPFTSDLFWVTEQRNVTEGNTGKRGLLFDAPAISFNGRIDTFIGPKCKWGLIDRSGAWVREPEFLEVRVFDYEPSELMWAKTEAGWGLIRADLSWQISPKFDNVRSVESGMAPVSLDGRWGFIDAGGRPAIEPQFDRVLRFSGPYAPAQVDKLYGLIDRTGAWVLSPQYEIVFSHKTTIPKSWWTIMADGKYGLLDDAFRVVLAPQFDQSPAMCADGRILTFNNRTPMLFLRDGTPDNDAAGCDSVISTRRK